MSTTPRVLFLDIETFPHIGYVWSKYDTNVIEFVQEGCIATFAGKWLDKDDTIVYALPDYPGYKKGSYDDKKLVCDLWHLLDTADIVVAHNGSDFDIRVIQSRFTFHGMKPPSPFKVVDTKRMAKKIGRFSSNSLNDLGQYFGLGKKIKTDFELWKGCINGDMSAWRKMCKYNKQDVLLLEQVYLRLLPFMTDHPNAGLWAETTVCPKCGSDKVQSRGLARTTTRIYRRFQCQSCSGWFRATKSEKSIQTTNVG